MCLGESHSDASKTTLHEVGPSQPECVLLNASVTECHKESGSNPQAPMKIRGPPSCTCTPVAVGEQQTDATTVTPAGVVGTIHMLEWILEWIPATQNRDSTFENPIDLTGMSDDDHSVDIEGSDHVTDNSTKGSDLDGAVHPGAERRDNHWVKFDPLKVQFPSFNRMPSYS